MIQHDERISKLTFASVYPHYVVKVEKKGRSKEELHLVIEWLTGFNEEKMNQLIQDKVPLKNFFNRLNLMLMRIL
jgi:hypothetical protein